MRAISAIDKYREKCHRFARTRQRRAIRAALLEKNDRCAGCGVRLVLRSTIENADNIACLAIPDTLSCPRCVKAIRKGGVR